MEAKNPLPMILVITITFVMMLVLDWMRWKKEPLCSISPLCVTNGSSPWPLASSPAGSGGQPIGNLYLQLNPVGSEYDVHPGLDLVVPVGEAVLAVEDGTVLESDTISSTYSEIVVQSAADPDLAWRYVHVVSFGAFENGKVYAGQPIGCVVPFDKGSNVDFHHLHLERIAPNANGDWSDPQPVEDPLELLKPTGDETPPTILAIDPPQLGGGTLAFALNRPLGEQSGPRVFEDPDALPEGNYDIIVNAYDVAYSGGPRVVPRCLRTFIREGENGTPQLFHTHLDGPLVDPNDVTPSATDYLPYQFLYGGGEYDTPLTSVAPLPGPGSTEERRFHLVATNQVFQDGFWEAKAVDGASTTYEVAVTVTDSSGLHAIAKRTVVVVP